jgi:membrane-anchored glycerophosphoryl diester phosphodiesterase (GDPDase)
MDGKLEALNLLKEWSNMLLVVQMSAIGFLGALLPKTSNAVAKLAALLSIVFFALSIIAAANLLGSLPFLAQRIDSVKNIYAERGNLDIPIQFCASAQALFFISGILAFTCFAALRRSDKEDN